MESKMETKNEVKGESCWRCRTTGVVSKFCPNCGQEMSVGDPGQPDPNKWGPGSKAKKLCEIPREFTEGGEEIDVMRNGARIFGQVMLTFDEFNEVLSMQKRRKWQDFVSRHGEPGAKRVINIQLPSVRGR